MRELTQVEEDEHGLQLIGPFHRGATCTGSATAVEPQSALVAVAFPPQPRTGEAPDYEDWWLERWEREQEITASASIVVEGEVFPISAIPPKNLEVIRLLDEWFSEPDDLGDEAWEELDRILAQGLTL